MKISSVCLALAVVVLNISSVSLFGQDASNDRDISEMQTTIDNLKAELESLKSSLATGDLGIQQNSPMRVPRTTSESFVDNQQSRSRTPAVGPGSQQRPSNYPATTQYEYPQNEYQQNEYPQHEYQQVDPYLYQPPVVNRVYVPQPRPVLIEPAYYPYRSYGASSRYGNYDNGYSGGGLYAGPNGWGFGVGGLQLNFGNGGGHYGNHGNHGNHGNYGNRGHKGHKGHK